MTFSCYFPAKILAVQWQDPETDGKMTTAESISTTSSVDRKAIMEARHDSETHCLLRAEGIHEE